MSSMKYCLQSGHSCYGAFYNHAGSHIMATTRDDHVVYVFDTHRLALELDVVIVSVPSCAMA